MSEMPSGWCLSLFALLTAVHSGRKVIAFSRNMFLWWVISLLLMAAVDDLDSARIVPPSTPSFIRPYSRNAHWTVFFFFLTPAAKAHRFSQTKCDFTSCTFQWPFDWFSAEVEEYFSTAKVLVCFLWNCWACTCVCFSYLWMFITARTSNEARCSWYAEKRFSRYRYAVCLDFIWTRDASSASLTISLVNLQTYFYEKMGLDARAVSSVYWLSKSCSHKPLAKISAFEKC